MLVEAVCMFVNSVVFAFLTHACLLSVLLVRSGVLKVTKVTGGSSHRVSLDSRQFTMRVAAVQPAATTPLEDRSSARVLA